MENTQGMPDAHRAPQSTSEQTSEQPTSDSPAEPIQPVPAGHPGIALLIMRARRRRSRETAELLAGVDLQGRPSGSRQSPRRGDQRPHD